MHSSTQVLIHQVLIHQLIEQLGATGAKMTLSLTTMSDKDAKSQSLVVCLEISDL